MRMRCRIPSFLSSSAGPLGLLSCCLILLSLGFATPATAQERGFTGSVGGGFTPVTGNLSNHLNNGWNVRASGGYNFNPHFSTDLEFTWNGLGVNDNVLSEAQVPGGNAHVWSLTLDPRLRLNPGHGVDPYLVGAVGYYRRTVQFTQPTLQPTLNFDPFFGFFQGLIPANQVLGSITRSGMGGGAGAGFEIHLGSLSHARLFTEARYEYANTGNVPTRMVPVTFGIRW